MSFNRQLYVRLIRMIQPHWRRIAIAMLAMLGVSGITALIAFLIKPALDDIFFGKRLDMLYILPPRSLSSTSLKGCSFTPMNI